MVDPGCESDAEYEFQDQLLFLRQITYYARYGDYTKLEVDKFLLEAPQSQELDLEAFKKLNGQQYWTEISQKLDVEKPVWDTPAWLKIEFRNSDIKSMTKTTSAVWRACERLGMDFERTIQVIHFYGNRKAKMHNKLEDIMKAGNWYDLAVMLYKDWIDIPSVLPAHWIENKEFMKAFLLEKMRRWYSWEDAEFYNPQQWIRTDQLEEDAKAILEKPQKTIEEIDILATDLALRSLTEKAP